MFLLHDLGARTPTAMLVSFPIDTPLLKMKADLVARQ